MDKTLIVKCNTAYLNHPYVTVQGGGALTYGGNQNFAKGELMRKCGCGVIAAADLLLYLCGTRPGYPKSLLGYEIGDESISQEDYEHLTEQLRRKYFPLIPGSGLNVYILAAGLNRFFRSFGIPLRAKWGVPGKYLWRAVHKMLDDDLPVILAIGLSFPFIWARDKLPFYTHLKEEYQRSGGAKSHFVTITGMDEKYLRISSWGREYYVLRKELAEYITKQSNSFLSNILYITNA